jgi:hypothetical protein
MNDNTSSAVSQLIAPTQSNPSTTGTTDKVTTVVKPLTHTVKDASSIVLNGFFQWKDTQQLLGHHVKTFLTMRKDLKEATRVLENLRIKAHTHAPLITLPKQIELHIVRNVKLPTVTGLPEFFKPEMDQLREFEAKANKEIFNIVETARQRHVTHLTHLASPNTFIDSTMKDLSQFVNRYADIIDQTLDPRGDSVQTPMVVSESQSTSNSIPPGQFPRKDALTQLRMTLEEEVMKILTRQAQEELATSAAQTAARLEDLAAQEQIQAGTHTGENIAMIATKAAQKVVYKELKVIQSKTDNNRRTQHSDSDSHTKIASSQSTVHDIQISPTDTHDQAHQNTSGRQHNTTVFQLHPTFFTSSIQNPNSRKTRTKRRAPGPDQAVDTQDDDNNAMDDTEQHTSTTVTPMDSKTFRRNNQPTPSFNRGGVPHNTQTATAQQLPRRSNQGRGHHTSRRR